MGLKLAVFVTLGLAAISAGQPDLHAQSVAPLPPIGLPLPKIGLPLSQIGLPLPRIGLPAVTVPVHRDGSRRPEPTRRRSRSRGLNQRAYFVPAFGWPYLYETSITAGAEASEVVDTTPPSPGTGWLTLDVEPAANQQIYVDGYYVGTPEDLAGHVELQAGPHVIEIRSPSFEELRVPINIAPGGSITYRGTLRAPTPAQAPPAATPAPAAIAGPMTGYYIIPGCYVGNVPPAEVVLPAGCDASGVIKVD